MTDQIKEKKPKYHLDPQTGEFVIENYNFSKPFANFFPGIAGKYGIPMWVFYVNRGQAISSFGTKDKDHCILEFFPANKSWQLTSLRGFRTFIKILNGKKQTFYEPFHNGFTNLGFKLNNQMNISSHSLKLIETNISLGIEIKVEYFTIPNDSYAALARIVTIKNTSRSNKKIQLLDGLPQIVPFGTNNLFLKKLGRTIEAWAQVKNLDKLAPFYKLDVDPIDRPEVLHIHEGNFFLSFHYEKNKPRMIPPVVDPELIFAPVTDFSCPYQFLQQKKLTIPKQQETSSKTACGFASLNLELGPGKEKTFYSLTGYMINQETLNSFIPKITSPGYLESKKIENKKIIHEIENDIATYSSSPEFDLYAKQTYLDNVIRGGYPLIFRTKNSNSVFYLYSRKHGDLERDYNKFQIEPTYFSQGNGNYRDVNQNRRSDNWFNPQIKEANIITFFSLLQTDGFNPLIVKGMTFLLNDITELKNALKNACEEKSAEQIVSFLNKPFTPGELILFIEKNKIKLKINYDDLLSIVLSYCSQNQEAEHGEGFWTDHWAYNLDLLESYLGLYPENLEELLFRKKIFTFFDNSEVVKPRNAKYVLREGIVKQLHALAADTTKKEIMRTRQNNRHLTRKEYGKGDIYYTTLINKLICLIANKLASLDPFGIGIEMETDKPNWFDALNGLPALSGSSLCETLELKRLINFIKTSLQENKIKKVALSKEILTFITELSAILKASFENNDPDRNYICWDKSSSLKEKYREQTKFGLSGEESELTQEELNSILDLAIKKLDYGIDKALDKNNNIYCAYFINEVVEYENLEPPYVRPIKFRQKRLPFFLESQMHALKINKDIAKAKKLYEAIKNSGLYDKKLKMYKVTESLMDMPEEIGRCRSFTPGWLENESIWLHMEYKYLLEILKSGLYKEFYDDFKNTLIPFQKPEIYGRNILENSSFLVSSAFPDKNIHGNGFVARLSGSTAEFLNIWLTMNLGLKPFFINEKGELFLNFSPILAGWLFEAKSKTYCFNFLRSIKITYHNPKRKNTFGKDGVKPIGIVFKDKNNNVVEIKSDTIPYPYAQQIRSCQINNIDIYLG